MTSEHGPAPLAEADSNPVSTPFQKNNDSPQAVNRDLEKGRGLLSTAVQQQSDTRAKKTRDSEDDETRSDTQERPATRYARSLLTSLGLNPSADIPGGDPIPETLGAEAKVSFFRVIDINFDRSCEPIIQGSCVKQDELEDCLAVLPQQRPKTARMYFCNFSLRDLKGAEILVSSHFRGLGTENFGIPRGSDILNLSKIALQWRTGNHESACFGIKIPVPKPTYAAYMQCILLDDDKIAVIFSFPKDAGETWRAQWSASISDSFFEQTWLQHLSIDRSGKDVIKLLILNILRQSIQLSLTLLAIEASVIKSTYKVYGYQAINYVTVEEHNELFSQFEMPMDIIQDIEDAIEFVISSIVRSQMNATNLTGENNPSLVVGVPILLQNDFEELRGAYKQLRKSGTRLQGYRDRRYNLYLDTLNIHESRSVKRLTALATGFLPLSLGASLLSMQTRFANLNLLLYDFVGVGLLLFFLTGVAYVFIKIMTRTASWQPFGHLYAKLENMKLKPWEERKLRWKIRVLKAFRFIARLFTIGIGIYIMATFQVGMFKEVSLGLKMLGYGVLGWFGLILSPILFSVTIVILVMLYRKSREFKMDEGNGGADDDDDFSDSSDFSDG